MPTKHLEHVLVEDPPAGVRVELPIGTADGDRPGPTLLVLGGVHGTEYAAQEAVQRFWRDLDPSRLTGRVVVVLSVDPLALVSHSAYVNPVDGKNLNRVWPGRADGTITERITHRIVTDHLRVADAVIDVHGGEWDEEIDCFVIAHETTDPEVTARTRALALAVGFPLVELTPAVGAELGAGTSAGTAAAQGIPALVLEAGGAGRRDPRYLSYFAAALENAMRHLGMVEGELFRYAGEPAVMDHGLMLRSPVEGVLQPRAHLGQWLQTGEVFAEVTTAEGELVHQIVVDESGVVIDVIVARGVRAGGFVGKLAVL
jgi:predicted deacylase